jgi:hypothetical protein
MLITAQQPALATPSVQSPPAAAQHQAAGRPAVPQKLAAGLPDYAPADCNTPNPGPNTVRCLAMVHTSSDHRITADTAGPPSTALTPADIQNAYRLPDGGEGQTVALVDAYGYSTAEADLAAYRSQFGLPECSAASGCFRKVDQRGGTDYPADDAGWAEETALDLDAVSSACPRCHILLVEGDTASPQDLGTAVDTAVALGAKFVSNSYDLPGEDPGETALNYYDHPGVVMTVASSDQANAVEWPASDPHVTAVGGTTLTRAPGTDRGWTESAWSSAGSGCSQYEPQPDFQADVATDCAHRATADVSADADPATGLAVYDTLGKGGWLQVGGTSLSSPLVAAMYALAGTPAAGTYPVTYPYADQGNHLFDVTEGSNGSCGVQCVAGAGWDGPTGLGTPNGVAALSTGPRGTVAGHVTDSAGGGPLTGAVVALTGKDNGLGFHATTDATGAFHVSVPAGVYAVTASEYGYGAASGPDVTVTVGATATADLSLVRVPSQTITGKVTDGSGHGWPLYAKITIDGYPNGALYTDPKTGTYSVELPRQADYTMHVIPVYPGYAPQDATVSLGTSDVRRDLALPADTTGCAAPGYAYPAQADFENWTGTASQHGWTVADDGTSGHAWEFDSQQWNLTGGTGNFAVADPFDNAGAAEDTELVTPALDFTHGTDTDLQFDTAYLGAADTAAEVDLSTDGGTTWAPVWQQSTGQFVGHVSVPLTAALGHSNVKIRFHFTGQGSTIWELDDITVGRCVPVAGGLVTGTVTDGNTHLPLDGATVTDPATPGSAAATTATPDDPGLSDGFYWMFSPQPGRHTLTTAADRYADAAGAVTVAADAVTTHDVALRAGRLAVAPGTVELSGPLGHRAAEDVTLTNTGSAPLRVTLGEQSGAFTALDGQQPASAASVPVVRVKGDYPTGPLVTTAGTASGGSREAVTGPPAAPAAGTGPAGAWQRLPDYPEQVMDNAVATYQGKAYSVGGVTGIVDGKALADAFVYDPVSAAWSRIADLPQALESPSAAFVDGTLYVVGGWGFDGQDAATEQTTVYAYDPAANTWTRRADMPAGTATASAAVLGTDLYVVGGCSDACATLDSAVYRYSTVHDTWTRVADYPTTMQWGACAGLGGQVVCGGGASKDADGHVAALKSAYVYHPRTNAWTQVADLPYTVWAMQSSGANGELQIVGGVVDGSGIAEGTNQALQYDPVANAWTALPNSPSPVFRAGGTGCGMYQIGGSVAHGFAFPVGTTGAQVLPGFTQCGGDDVTWLSENRTSIVLAPGQSVHVRVTADASVLAAAGDYAATLSPITDTPYLHDPVPVTFHVTPGRFHGHS